jgi:hypothetical protein
MRSSTLFASLLLMLAPACEGRLVRPDAGRGDPGDGTETAGECGDGADNDLDGLLDCADPDCAPEVRCGNFDGGMRTDRGFEECSGVDYNAETRNAPIDIIWVIDNSGSMSEEAAQIQMRLNSFVAAIDAAGIDDYHVALITTLGFVDVPEPLRSDAERFRFIDTNVQSTDSFQWALDRIPRNADFFRRDAVTHFVFVTDDESDMAYEIFRDQMRTELGHPFTAHAVVSPPGSTHMPAGFPFTLPGCSSTTGGEAAENGDRYWELALATGGLQLSICTNDWTELFNQLLASVAVAMRIPCSFDIPVPDEGTFQSNLVNLVYTPSSTGVPVTIPRSSTGDCLGDGFTWVYDDPITPTAILLCTSACTTVDGDPGGAIRIQLGCESILD